MKLAEIKKKFVGNKRLLMALSAAALVLFAAAYLLGGSHEPSQNDGGDTEQTEVMPEPVSDTETGNLVKNILSDDEYQSELPVQSRTPQPQNFRMPGWVLKTLFYALVGLGIFAVASFIWVLITGNRGALPLSPAVRKIKSRKRADQQPIRHSLIQPATLADAEKLAADGRYGEAVRFLLAACLIDLSNKRLVQIKPSMTGREIAGGASLVQEAQEALRALVITVEAYAFAEEKVSKSAYEQALEKFRFLEQAAGAGA